ncbi:MAG TPA: response regulator [Desulfocapsa sulfexigens]|nr:response regulator [Desulfocapsa sulfexigens]
MRSLEDEQADLILLDVMMPGMNGFETCKRLKKNVNTVDIPVIFMTALSSIEDKVTGFKAGGVDYITKPFNKAEVLARLQTHLNLRKQKQKLDRTLNELRMQSDTLEQQVQERTMALENSNSQMQLQKQEILEKNIALKVVLDHHKLYQKNYEEMVAGQLKQLVYPYLELLQQNIRLEENKEYVSLIGKHLDSIVASFSGSTFSPGWKLTAKESLVADLVKKGKNTKEIGILLKISPRTAETYRNSIRKKIGPLQTNLWVISGTGKYITKSSGISVTAP